MQISSSNYYSAGVTQRYQAQAKAESTDVSSNKVGDKQAKSVADPEQQRVIQNLKDRDKEVRNHEQAHLAAAGGIATRGASFDYVSGPDGRRYAVGGEVSIDTSAVANDPQATLRKAESIRRAALAPAQPSAQDYSVASKAAAMAQQANVEILRTQQNTTERSGSQLDVRA